MFGFLKKKLKEGIDKISKKVKKKEEEIIEEVVEEIKKEEKIEEPKEELVKEVEEELEEEIEGVKITYFVHGTTTDNEERKSTGWAPGELSELGKRQSVELKDKIKDKKFDVVFCSDLKRAADSAKLTWQDEIQIIEDERLREVNYGDLTQADSDKVEPSKIEQIDKPFPSGESYKVVEKRISEFLNYLFDNYEGKHVAIVAHQAPQLALDVLLRGKTWEQAMKEDWRINKKWQPGWDYELKEKVEIPEIKEEIPEVIEEPEIEKEIVEEETTVEPEVKEPTVLEEVKEELKKEEIKPEIKEVKPEIKIREKPVEKKEEPKKEIKVIEKPKEEKKEGILKRIRRKVTEKKISEEDVKEMLEDFRKGLIESDVAVDVSEKIVNDLKGNLVGKFLKRSEVEKIIKESFRKSILEVLDVDGLDLIEKVKSKKPFIVIFLGFNGSGKTTTIARIGHLLKQKGFTCVLAAADSWRAAAIEQLEEHGRNLGLTVIKHKYGADPAAVIFDAVKHAKAKDIDVVLADTAGRSHANTNLVDELKKIVRVNKPDMKVLVLDALTGNDIYDQCKIFNDAVGVDALVITKADVYEKGGAALSASHTINKPILYLGVGQNYEDLEKFDPEKIVERLLE